MKTFPVHYEKMFQTTFRVPLRKFFHPMWGFDVIALDDWLATQHGYDIETSGKSAAEFVTEKFGEAATKMIYALIKL